MVSTSPRKLNSIYLFILRYTLCSFSLFLNVLNATEIKPWFDKDKEIEVRVADNFQWYRHVKGAKGTQNHASYDNFVTLSITSSPDISYSGEFELITGKTSQHSFITNCEALTLRYLILNDVVGDPLSLSAGISIRHVHHLALEDISNFYHGPYEFELHCAAGKEIACGGYWTSRWWGIAATGIASEGSPWFRANFSWENNWWDRHQCQLFANTLWGTGAHQLNLSIPFQGYGSIHHQSIDLGASYSYAFDFYGTVSIAYAYRVYAQNAPTRSQNFFLNLLIPLGL